MKLYKSVQEIIPIHHWCDLRQLFKHEENELSYRINTVGVSWWLRWQDCLRLRSRQWFAIVTLSCTVEYLCLYRRTVTKRTFGQTGLVIHTWYASHSLIKTIWIMAISQHQFYLNRKQSKVSQNGHNSVIQYTVRDWTELVLTFQTLTSFLSNETFLIHTNTPCLLKSLQIVQKHAGGWVFNT